MALTRPDVVLLGLVAVIGIGAVVAVAVSRPESEYGPGSPEATVQELLRASGERDPAALDLVDPELGCTLQDVDNAWMPRDLRVDLLEAEVTGDTARVRVEVIEGTDMLGGYERTEGFGLERRGSSWVITDMTWPMWCEGSLR